ncbi:MAG TPA: glycosyltransferase [Candidatus Limnocylindrales bacterium]|nr:glycosyltransferase [Candidatus Limnocylindrales bacterium]
MINLKSYTFAIVTHVYATGPSFKLEEYLIPKSKTLIFIGHPFAYSSDTRSFLRIYKHGELVVDEKFLRWKGPELIFYIKDIILTAWWLTKYNHKIDYYIGVDSLNFLVGYFFKYFKKIHSLVYYTIDYVPQRSSNSILNSAYHFLDRLGVSKSDKVWNLSKVMVEVREKNGVIKKYRKKQIVVPVGTDINVKVLPFSKINKNKVVFMGHLREGQGVDLLISAMIDVIKKIPNAHLLIIGGGPLESHLKKIAKTFKMEKHIKFSGFVKEFSDVEKMLQDSAIAVAPYVDDKKTYTRYTDPGKPKDYLAHGIPVIITKVPQVAYEIHKNKCGFAIDYNEEELSSMLIKLLQDKKQLAFFRKNALEMAQEYSWNKIFNNALQGTLF